MHASAGHRSPFDLRNALVPLGELGQIFDHLREAERLAEALGDQRRLGWASALMTNYFWMRGDYDHALGPASAPAPLPRHLGTSRSRYGRTSHLGQVYHALGDYRQAIDVLRWNVAALTGELRYERSASRTCPPCSPDAWLVRCLTEVGAFAEGMALGDEAIQIAEAVDHPFSRSEAYGSVGLLHLRQGDLPKAIPVLERGLEVCQAANIQLFVLPFASNLGAAIRLVWAYPAEALPLLKQAVAQHTAMGR